MSSGGNTYGYKGAESFLVWKEERLERGSKGGLKIKEGFQVGWELQRRIKVDGENEVWQ